MDLISAVLIVVLIIYSAVKDWLHQKQIDQLTNKLMSKDFTEYKVNTVPEEPAKPEPENEIVDLIDAPLPDFNEEA